MASQKPSYTAEEAFDLITKDCSTAVCVEDSSSEDEDLIFPDNDDGDLDFKVPQLESDDDEPPGPPTTPRSPRSRAMHRTSKRPDLKKPGSFVKAAPQKKQKATSKVRSPDEEDSDPDSSRFGPAREPGPTFDRTVSWSPLSLFHLFFNASAICTLIDNTNANAAKKTEAGRRFPWTPLTEEDFYVFLAIIVFTGVVRSHHRSDYWNQNWPFNFQFPQESMSRDRFEAILWSLHLSDPKDDEENEKKKGTPDYDRLCKLKPLYNHIVTACTANFHPYRNICIDDRMLPSKVRVGMQPLRTDPTRWGYKLYVLVDVLTGYTWSFFVYTEKSESSTGQGPSNSSVADLLQLSLLGGGYTLFLDKKRIGCSGTIRRDRLDFPPADENDSPKKSGGWRTKALPVPDSVLDGNEDMDEVDPSELMGLDPEHYKTMKWYKIFFITLLRLPLQTASSCISSSAAGSLVRCTHKHSSGCSLQRKCCSLLSAPRLHPHQHQPACHDSYYDSESNQSRRYCRRCQEAGILEEETQVYCTACNVPLCFTSERNCFVQWHRYKM